MNSKTICDFRTNIFVRYIALIPSIIAGHRALIRVKFTLKPKIRTEGVEVKLNSFFDLCARWVWVVNVTLRPLYPQERTVV
jgi:hypothetical protein